MEEKDYYVDNTERKYNYDIIQEEKRIVDESKTAEYERMQAEKRDKYEESKGKKL